MPTEQKQSAEPKQDPRDLVIGILVGALIFPFVGMLRALTCRLLWDWFLASQYGEGPALKTWFGIGVLTSLIMFRQAASSDLPKNPVWSVLGGAFSGLLVLGGVIVAAAMARVVWGW